MVWINLGGRRRRGYGGFGNGYRGYGPRGGGGGGGGGCLRDLFLLETGCCLAEAIGCGPSLLLLAPAAAGLLLSPPATSGERQRAVRLVRLYQERISPRRSRPCCRMTPSCSAYAVGALHEHGTWRGTLLTVARLLRCRPGGPVGADPVPAGRSPVA